MKIFVSTLLFSALCFFSSCEGDQTVRYKFTDLKVANLDTSPGMPRVDNGDSLRKEVFGLRLNLYPVETYRKGRYFDAYESSVTPENAVKKITIITDQPFDAAHPAGSEITNYFTYFPGNYMYCEPLHIGEPFSPTAKYSNDYAEHNYPQYADLLLTSMPDNTLCRKFHVTLELYGGTIWTDSTKLVKLY